MTARPFNAHVRVGNWQEDLNLEEVELKLTLVIYLASTFSRCFFDFI